MLSGQCPVAREACNVACAAPSTTGLLLSRLPLASSSDSLKKGIREASNLLSFDLLYVPLREANKPMRQFLSRSLVSIAFLALLFVVSATFFYAVPLAVGNNRFAQVVSIAFGAICAVQMLTLAAFRAFAKVRGTSSESNRATCPYCGQPMPQEDTDTTII